MNAGAYFVPAGPGRFRSTEHAQGAWSADEQHMGPVSGLLVHALEACAPRDDLVMSRVAFDILGQIPAGEVAVSARVVRPGRTIELLEAEMSADGRLLVRATAWRLLRSDTTRIAGTDLTPLPPPESGRPFDGSGTWPGGFIRSLDIRTLGEPRPGRAQVWLRSGVELLAGRTSTDLASLFALVDTANGIAVRVRPGEAFFPNTDLTVHLFRQPVGRWLGLDTEVSFGGDGTGLTASVLHDRIGPIGRAAQTLTLRMTAGHA
ncbi:thioesterase family protein [Nakamurella endophytica]